MNILILGSGGREHSLAWATNQNPKCDTLYCAPGNAGIALIATCVKLDIENGSDVVLPKIAQKSKEDAVKEAVLQGG